MILKAKELRLLGEIAQRIELNIKKKSVGTLNSLILKGLVTRDKSTAKLTPKGKEQLSLETLRRRM